MAITVTGKNLTIEDIVAVARHGEKVELHPDAVARIAHCRAFFEKRIEAREIMYGVNTGIGEFSEVVLDDDAGPGFPELPDLQPRRRHRRALSRGPRPGRHAAADQCPRQRPLRLPAGDHPDPGCDAQRRRHAGGLREGLGRGLRRPRAHEPDRAPPHGRGRGVLPGRAPARAARPWRRRASRCPGCRPATGWRPSTAPT